MGSVRASLVAVGDGVRVGVDALGVVGIRVAVRGVAVAVGMAGSAVAVGAGMVLVPDFPQALTRIRLNEAARMLKIFMDHSSRECHSHLSL
jgi:hypothetical protein